MRPVVLYISTPTYKLAKYLDMWFKNATGFHPPFSVMNSIELSEILTQEFPIPPPGSVLVSFDVVGLYPYVPFSPTCERMEELLMELLSPLPSFLSSNPYFIFASALMCVSTILNCTNFLLTLVSPLDHL